MGGKSNRGRERDHSKAPLERLEHSHRRLESRLQELQDHSQRIVDGTADHDASWDVIDEVLHYLQRAGVRHERDEEDTVFPVLEKHPTLRPLLQRLRGDHQSQGKLVETLATLIDARERISTPAKLLKCVQTLRAAYLDHIQREDRELLPAITRHVSPEEQETMAREMAERRGH